MYFNYLSASTDSAGCLRVTFPAFIGRQVERRSDLKGRFLGNWRAKKGFLASLPFCTDLKSTTQNIRKPISVQPENQFSGTHPTMTVTFTFQSKVTGPIRPAHISWKCVLLAFFTSGHSAQLMTPQTEISILGSRKIPTRNV